MTELRRYRRELGLTQAELADRAGCSRPTVSKVEAGSTVPSVDRAMRLAACLGVRVEDLWTEAGARR